MKTETIGMCVVALLLGMLLANMLQNVCGCKVVEGTATAYSDAGSLVVAGGVDTKEDINIETTVKDTKATGAAPAAQYTAADGSTVVGGGITSSDGSFNFKSNV